MLYDTLAQLCDVFLCDVLLRCACRSEESKLEEYVKGIAETGAKVQTGHGLDWCHGVTTSCVGAKKTWGSQQLYTPTCFCLQRALPENAC